uniref:Peroxisomal membrane protein 2 n=1 Tax=Cardiosporidium cionae TaxID=476202 RepID=A0A3S8V2V8_9APIC|nr:peroxisomal membrane protein 2 [Cardiosporidium cionae]
MEVFSRQVMRRAFLSPTLNGIPRSIASLSPFRFLKCDGNWLVAIEANFAEQIASFTATKIPHSITLPVKRGLLRGRLLQYQNEGAFLFGAPKPLSFCNRCSTTARPSTHTLSSCYESKQISNIGALQLRAMPTATLKGDSCNKPFRTTPSISIPINEKLATETCNASRISRKHHMFFIDKRASIPNPVINSGGRYLSTALISKPKRNPTCFLNSSEPEYSTLRNLENLSVKPVKSFTTTSTADIRTRGIPAAHLSRTATHPTAPSHTQLGGVPIISGKASLTQFSGKIEGNYWTTAQSGSSLRNVISRWYFKLSQFFESNLLFANCFTAGSLFMTADYLCQLMENKSKVDANTGCDYMRILRLGAFAIFINGPLYTVWYGKIIKAYVARKPATFYYTAVLVSLSL